MPGISTQRASPGIPASARTTTSRSAHQRSVTGSRSTDDDDVTAASDAANDSEGHLVTDSSPGSSGLAPPRPQAEPLFKLGAILVRISSVTTSGRSWHGVTRVTPVSRVTRVTHWRQRDVETTQDAAEEKVGPDVDVDVDADERLLLWAPAEPELEPDPSPAALFRVNLFADRFTGLAAIVSLNRGRGPSRNLRRIWQVRPLLLAAPLAATINTLITF